MPTTPDIHTEHEMPDEIDFSGAMRGKFYRQGMKLRLPVYLDDALQARLSALASARGIELSALVNELLRKDLEFMEVLR